MRTIDTDSIQTPILPNIGAGIPFECTIFKESHGPAVTALSPRRFNAEGMREATMEITSWVGISIGANHHYVSLGWEGCTFHTPDGEPHPKCNTWPNNMPREAESTRLEIRRPVTQRDIEYARKRKDGWIPRSGDTERGFWSEQEARDAGIAYFKENFAPGWVLMTHDDNGDLVEIART